MKIKHLHLILFLLIALSSKAQTDITEKIVNPSFEDDGADVNLPDNPTGWTWTGTDGYAWCGVNSDAEDDQKTGTYIVGTWNQTFGDVELSQTITGLENGTYKVGCDLMGGSSNGTTSRMTLQRLFANGKSMLYGAEGSDVYSSDNLQILSETEEYSFGGYAEVESDRGPLETLNVEVEVTEGSLTLGIRTNGLNSTQGYTFPTLTEGDGHGWFKVDNFTLTLLSSTTNVAKIENNMDFHVKANNNIISVVEDIDYQIFNLTGATVPQDTPVKPGVYIVRAKGQSKKVMVGN